MRRRVNKPFSIPRQDTGTGQSWRRQAGAEGSFQFPASPQSHSNSLIDEKLIEGSQVSSSSSSVFRKPYRQNNGSLSYQPRSDTQLPVLSTSIQQDEVFEDEDVQLDAFDLELLAQSDGKANNYQQPLVSSYHRQVEPAKQVSRFFNGLHDTPHRSIPSNSSDIDTREVSSPLARIQNERTTGVFRNRDRDLGGNLSQSYSIGVDERYVEPSTDFPASHHGPSNPFQDIPVSVRGIVLLSVRELPDNYRSLFHFPVFNAVQSKCFQAIYKSDDNVVLAAPTGSGKTVVMELAICRLLNTLKDEQFKVVYQAPTKSLCSERFRDWSRKFQLLGLQCAELTGDTDHSQLRNVQNSQIIVTTPEKWDSMTRKWKDHARLMQLVKLFLIDEVHTLKEARGATLEAVVSRMKTIGSNVRLVALSATIPNSEDIATWLGRNATSQHVPAHREHFGEEFRPVKLQKFVYGYQSHSNDFAFDKLLNSKLSDVIGTHSAKKPIMIFCCTRNSAVTTAKELARLWSKSNHPARLWKGPSKPMPVCNADLKTTTAAGVAFHHAGLEPADRNQVENGYIEGKISIICCTSTLAIGVNLPCHLAIIKNTVGWQDGCCQEYSDLEVMQMLGRAGRPQFDDTATAVILTRKERVHHYEKLVSGSESLESCLHLNLIDHLNAEIGLGNVTSLDSATTWLAGTFLFVRLRRNPTHYKLKEGANRDDEDEMLRQICEKDIKLLQECDLVASSTLKSTPFGEAMARYYIRFETMKTLLALKPQSGVAEILAAISQAEEFRDVRLKAGEKSVYKQINRSSDLTYPINVDIARPAHKISLLIQSELGAVEFPSNEQFQKHKFTFQQDKNFVFSHVNRLIRCVIDCQVHLGDSVTIRNALELARSLAARVWDSSPLQMKQIEQVGAVAVRKLVAAGIDSIEALEGTEPHCIDMALSKNPPFGVKLRSRLEEFPKLRVSVKMTGKDVKPGRLVTVRFKAEIAFMNEKCPSFFQRRPVYVCFVAETSDGRLIDFRRLSATKLQKNYEISLSGELKQHNQYIICHVMCDEIAATSRCATLKPILPKQPECSGKAQQNQYYGEIPTPEPYNNEPSNKLKRFDTDDLLFGELLNSDILDDWHDEKAECQPMAPSKTTVYQKITSQSEGTKPGVSTKADVSVDWEPRRLDNGKWACNHKCKDKTSCKHYCCREGLSNPPKASRKKSDGAHADATGPNQLTLSPSIPKSDSRPFTHQKKSKSSQQQSSQLKTPSTDNPISLIADSSSDYGDESFDDLPSPSEFFGNVVSSLDHDSQKAPGISKTSHNPLELGDNWIDADEVSFPGRPTLVDSPSTNYGSTKTCLVDLVSPEPQKLCSIYPQSDGFRGQKRKLTDRSDIDNDDNKRAKTLEEPDCVKKDSPKKGEKGFTEGNEAKTSQMCDIPVVCPVPTDWEGIDPALLNDFKDIIDFF